MAQLRLTGWQRREQVCASRGQGSLPTPPRVLGGARAAVRTAGRAAMVQVNEAVMLMSAAAMTPLRLLGGGFDGPGNASPPVKAATAPTSRPVLLVHGFAGTTSSWSLVAHTLRARGLTVEAMSYPPLGTSVEQLAEQLVAEVEKILGWNRCRQGAFGRTQSGRCCHRAGHRRPSSQRAGRHGHHPGLAVRRVALGGCAAVYRDRPGAALGFAGVTPGRRRTIARRHAVAVGDSRTRHHRARAAFGTIARPGGSHQVRRCRPSRDAPESAGNRLHSRRVVRTADRHRR